MVELDGVEWRYGVGLVSVYVEAGLEGVWVMASERASIERESGCAAERSVGCRRSIMSH